MKLHEIIAANENHETAILIEKMLPYKNSLLKYYSDYFCAEPVLMVTSVSNAAQYGKIVSANEFTEAICAYMQVPYVIEDSEEQDFNEDLFTEYETINFNSMI